MRGSARAWQRGEAGLDASEWVSVEPLRTGTASVRAGGGLGRPKRHRRRRLTAPAHAGGNAHATGEVAIGEAETGDRTTEALVIHLVEIEARLERNALAATRTPTRPGPAACPQAAIPVSSAPRRGTGCCR